MIRYDYPKAFSRSQERHLNYAMCVRLCVHVRMRMRMRLSVRERVRVRVRVRMRVPEKICNCFMNRAKLCPPDSPVHASQRAH